MNLLRDNRGRCDAFVCAGTAWKAPQLFPATIIYSHVAIDNVDAANVASSSHEACRTLHGWSYSEQR